MLAPAMAASIDNRRFGEAFVCGCSFPPLLPLASAKERVGCDGGLDDEDEDEEMAGWKKKYGGSHHEAEPAVRDPRDEGTADYWVERSPSLIRLTGKHPLNCEPPLGQLMHHGFITPVPLHYVRNHGAVPRADWGTWTVEITGLVKRPLRLTMDELVHDFPPVEIPVTLVCAGNRRKEQNMVRQTMGFNWGPAAISTAVWRGARLRDVLRRCGIRDPKDGALFVCFEGAEDLPGCGGGGGSKYGTSLRREAAMDASRDVMLAYMQNGELLKPDHGFPVRIIIPGFIGGRMVKWLRRIIVAPQESNSYYHYKDNRVLPSHVDEELADAEAWWYKPEYIINELNINSVIITPRHDEMLLVDDSPIQQPFLMRGYAYSGGGRKVTRVDITYDGGETWLPCALHHPEKPNKFGKYWCWCFWSVAVEVMDLLGAKEVAVRAWDESLNTQPEKLIWNVMGMMNNCWFKVKVNVRRHKKDEIGLVFEHPTQPGNQSGGWMAQQRHLETSEVASMKKSVFTPRMSTSPERYAMSKVREHASAASVWIVVHDHVYDCTAFIKDHPGGADSILVSAGSDCTEEFDAIHSDKARALLEAYRIGELAPSGNTSEASLPATIREVSRPLALVKPHENVQCKLVSRKAASRNVRLFRFALPSADQVLDLPVGKHIFLYATINDKLCMRPYTPTSPVDEVGHLELLIKVYFKGENAKFPNGGLMSQHLESLPVGSTLDVKGPFGHIEYTGRGNFLVQGKPRIAKRLAMIAGGTGITPVYQVIRAALQDPEDHTEMHLVYANRTTEDILLREELDGWAREHPAQLKAWYVISEVKQGERWRYSTGRVTESILRGHIPVGGSDDTLALACGPPPMIQLAVVPNLEKMGYDTANSLLLF
ncbi:hypothetical protein BHM03_00036574 [Ensete ventricosum]|nr:hypothetical protein BHM03_00036574 [Ensete ventricosum]